MNEIKADFVIDERTTYPFAISDGTNPQMLIKIAGESP